MSVVADDGVSLHAEVVGTADASLTVIFCHGAAADQECWRHQRRALGEGVRMVFWDQRGHGRSGRSSLSRATIDQLGHDLRAVIEATAPPGKVVLVGHSLGGATITSFAGHYPSWFGPRVSGVALLATTSTIGTSRPFNRALLARFSRAARWSARRPALLHAGRRVARVAERTRLPRVMGTDPRAAAAMFASLPPRRTDLFCALAADFAVFDRRAALPAFAEVETLIIGGEEDRLLPPDPHSLAIAAAVPSARLEIVAGAGHLVMMDRPTEVNRHLRALFDRC